MSSDFSIKDQIENTFPRYRHIVILGAGASIACVKDKSEKNDRVLPSMNTLTEVVGIKELVNELPNHMRSGNFENLFAQLYNDGKYEDILRRIEDAIYSYFDNLELSDEPTIYDYLLLSLRKKDLIATFNWDPFLFQAYHRNRKFTENLPQMAYLHGTVAFGICLPDQSIGPKYMPGKKSGEPHLPCKLLYPISKKDYSSDPFIRNQWELLRQGLKDSPVRITIFGYSAPVSDVEAIQLMSQAYGSPEKNPMTQFEMIDIKEARELRDAWSEFVHTHHYETHESFFESSIACFPRRTGEAFRAQFMESRWLTKNTIPKGFHKIEEAWNWYSKFLPFEKDEL